jgi:pseudouridine synthase
VIRLQKALADRGVASRRRAEELIADGRVRVDGEVVTTLGTRVAPDARIDVDGAATRVAALRHIALHKPRGFVSTARDERGRRSVVDLVGLAERVYPVGRLDADSEGLLLLTNDGEWAERVLHPRYGHEREYEVSVVGDVSAPVVERLRRGVRLEEGLARAVRVEVTRRGHGSSVLRVVLRTGWRRQIRRMCVAVGLRVVRLVRVRIGPLALGRLRPGEWRELSDREVAALAEAGGRTAGARTDSRSRPSKRR